MQIEVRKIKPVDPPKEYVLTINQNELEVLRAILGQTSGYDGDTGWRSIVDQLYVGLKLHAKVEAYSIVDFDGSILSHPKVKPI
jgi:hypothetical protein